MTENEKKYLEFAEMLSELSSSELKIHNLRRIVEELKSELSGSGIDGGFGIEISAHAFRQISERLEVLAFENIVIYNDVFGNGVDNHLLLPSKLKSFIITLIADARSKGNFTEERSKNTNGGVEYRYVIEIKKWNDERSLQMVCIVENGNVKTGYFNWV